MGERNLAEILVRTELKDVTGALLGEVADEICSLRTDVEKLTLQRDLARTELTDHFDKYEAAIASAEAARVEVERLTKERNEARSQFDNHDELLHQCLEDRDGYRVRAQSAEASLAKLREKASAVIANGVYDGYGHYEVKECKFKSLRALFESPNKGGENDEAK